MNIRFSSHFPDIRTIADRAAQESIFIENRRKEIEKEKEHEKAKDYIHPFIAISREAGSGGTIIANMVGKKMGWEVFDKSQLQMLSHKHHVSLTYMMFQDEKPLNFLDKWFCGYSTHTVVPDHTNGTTTNSQEELLSYQKEMMTAEARKHNIVFVGRGAHFLLPAGTGFSVRITAPKEDRIKFVMEEKKINYLHAKKIVEEVDHDRVSYMKHFFHCSPHDLSQYDLVLNSHALGYESCVNIIIDSFRERFPTW